MKLRERDEEKAAQALAKADRAVTSAQAAHEDAKARAMMDFRARNDVSQWELQELAQHRALAEEKKAAQLVAAAKAVASKSRDVFTVTHQRAEVVRRVADARRDELTRELDRSETKQLDEVAGLLFNRR